MTQPDATEPVKFADLDPIEVDWQGVVYFDGTGLPLIIDDRMDATNLGDYISDPIARAVMATRLRAIADMLDTPSEVQS